MTDARIALVSGADGFVGSALVRHLAERGTTVLALVRDGARRGLPPQPEVRVLRVGEYRAGTIRAALGGERPDVVYHLASYGVHPEARDPARIIEGNVGITAQLLLALAGKPPDRFVHTGSCSEYAESGDGGPLGEDSPIGPLTLYGAAKAAAMIVGRALAHRLAIPFVTLRPFGIYGPGEAPHRLLPSLIDRLSRGAPVDLSPGEQVRDLLYVEDLVEALRLAGAAAGLAAGEVYNVCSGVPVRVREVALLTAELMRRPRELLRFGALAYRDGETLRVVGDNRRFRAASGWEPRWTLREGIAATIRSLART